MKLNLFSHLRNQEKFTAGFTVVETLVAISILSLSVVATFAAVQGGLQDSILVKDQISAFYMAQEAVEYVKDIRNDNSLLTLSGTPTPWLTGIPAACFTGKACRLDSFHKQAVACDSGWGTCPNIQYLASEGLFGYDVSWANTVFKREVQFTNISANEVRLTVRVSWVTKGTNKSFQITESLFTIQ